MTITNGSRPKEYSVTYVTQYGKMETIYIYAKDRKHALKIANTLCILMECSIVKVKNHRRPKRG